MRKLKKVFKEGWGPEQPWWAQIVTGILVVLIAVEFTTMLGNVMVASDQNGGCSGNGTEQVQYLP